MLSAQVVYDRTKLEDPIGGTDMDNYFEAYKLVPSVMVDRGEID